MKEDNKTRLERLKNIVLNMPEKPGSYQYFDADGVIIYVGKAKNLKRRVSSYFHKEVDRYKTKVLVSKIHNISYTVVNSEEDALLLENALIKKYNPRYNILLKDGKTYPSICITNEYFPRIFTTRNIPQAGTQKSKRGGEFFGPYTHLGSMYTVLDFVKKLYHPRTCRQPITPDGVRSGKYKPCLEYHIGNCGGPCINKQSYEEYQQNMLAAREILKGNTRQLQQMVWQRMLAAAEEMRFEDAQRLKEQYALIEQYCAKSEVVSQTITDVDVITAIHPTPLPLPGEGREYSSINNISNYNSKDDFTPTTHTTPLPREGSGGGVVFINYMHVKNGTINQSFTFEYKCQLNESAEDVLIEAIPEFRSRFASTAKEIIVEKELEWQVPGATYFVPQRGDKAHLLELSLLNCKQYRLDRLKQTEKLNPEQRATRLMTELRDKLGLPTLPYIIEAFDNSNIQGSDAVAGCVVFKAMKPSKKDYKRYNIKTVTGPDDYASMQEVVERRYTRMVEEGTPLPNLIICDGGLGQMSSVKEIVHDKLHLEIPVAGLAKNDKHRTNELLYGDPPQSVQLKTDSELFRVLTQLQDEVHRYAINFHREKRSKRALHSELEDIPGIGEKTRETLLKRFKSVKRIREATLEELTETIGQSKATIIFNYLKTKHYET